MVVDPGIGVEETLRAVLTEHRLRPAAVLLTHGHIDHVYSVTPVCGGRPAAYIHADDRYRSRRPARNANPGLLGHARAAVRRQGDWTEPSTVVEIKDRTRLDLAGLDVEVLHAPGHTEGSVMFSLARRARRIGRRGGRRPHGAQRRRALRRLDRPHRPARRRRGSHEALAARRRAARCLTRRWCCPGTARPPRCSASGRPTPTCKDWPREPVSTTRRQGHPDQRLPRVPPRRADRRAALPRRHPRDLRAARVPLDRDPRRGARRPPARQGRRRRQGDLRRRPAGRRRGASGATPSSACTSTSRCRSPATSWRTPATSPSRSGATRSRRCGGASGRRRAATASSPRPTSTSSTWASWQPHFEAEIPLVMAEVFRKLPIGRMVIQVNNRKIPEGFYLGIGIEDVAGDAAHRRQARQDRPRQGQATCSSTAGRTTRAGRRSAWRWPPSAPRTCRFVEQVRALGVQHPTLDEGLEALSRGHPGRPGQRPRRDGGRPARSPAASTTTPAPSTRPSSSGHESWGSFCSGGRYDSLASDGRTTYPGVGISIGVSRLLGLLLGKGLLTASRSTPACVLVAVNDEEAGRRPPASRPRCARAAYRARWRPSRPSSASRSGMPSGGGCRTSGSRARGEQRRPGQGHPLAATRSTPTRRSWQPPAEDLRPQILRARE